MDVTDTQMPDVPVGFSWEMELHDIDNDWDLDALVSCKSCQGSVLLLNDEEWGFHGRLGPTPVFLEQLRL